jgi:hypothetical protein
MRRERVLGVIPNASHCPDYCQREYQVTLGVTTTVAAAEGQTLIDMVPLRTAGNCKKEHPVVCQCELFWKATHLLNNGTVYRCGVDRSSIALEEEVVALTENVEIGEVGTRVRVERYLG